MSVSLTNSLYYFLIVGSNFHSGAGAGSAGPHVGGAAKDDGSDDVILYSSDFGDVNRVVSSMDRTKAFVFLHLLVPSTDCDVLFIVGPQSSIQDPFVS